MPAKEASGLAGTEQRESNGEQGQAGPTPEGTFMEANYLLLIDLLRKARKWWGGTDGT